MAAGTGCVTACATTLCHPSLLHPRTMGLRSVTILLGTALLLLAPGSTQVSPASPALPLSPLIRGPTCDPCHPPGTPLSPHRL